MSSTYSPYPNVFSLASTRCTRSPSFQVNSFFGIPFPSRLIFAANSTASMIFLYPVQRQMLLRSANAISSLVGFGFLSRSPFVQMTIPGIQNPHCTAPASAKAYAYSSFSSSEKPSTVRIDLPSIMESVGIQAFIATPSTST